LTRDYAIEEDHSSPFVTMYRHQETRNVVNESNEINRSEALRLFPNRNELPRSFLLSETDLFIVRTPSSSTVVIHTTHLRLTSVCLIHITQQKNEVQSVLSHTHTHAHRCISDSSTGSSFRQISLSPRDLEGTGIETESTMNYVLSQRKEMK
jgi:hypothetical protein